MLSPKLLQILRAWWPVHRPKQWLFPGDRVDSHISRVAVEDACQKAHRRCGIPKPVTPHCLRHCFATHLIESGVELPVVQRLMGHASLMTTALYLHVTECRLGEVHSPLDLIDTSHLGR